MFEELLEDYAYQLAFFEEKTFGQISEIEEHTFTELDGSELGNDYAQVSEDSSNTYLDESRFISLDEEAFAELDEP